MTTQQILATVRHQQLGTTVYLCGNEECLVRFTAVVESLEEECAREMQSAAFDVLRAAGLGVETSRTFRDWNGGRFDQFYVQPHNHIAVSKGEDIPLVVAACEAAGDAMSAVVAKYEAIELVEA